MPGFTFPSEHEEYEKRNEGAFQNEGVERTDAAKKKRVYHAGIRGGRDRVWRVRGSSEIVDASFEAAELSLNRARSLAQNASVSGQFGGEFGAAHPQAVAHCADRSDQDENHEERA